MRKWLIKSFGGFLALGLFLAAAGPAQALPRYAVAYGQNCILCHASPTGGGMRSSYATQYLIPEEIAARGWESKGTEGMLEDFSPELSPNVTVGVDARTLVFQAEQGDGSLITMQGDLYFQMRMSTTASVYLERSQNGAGEAWGLLTGLPASGYARFGRFMPDFGWRFADHRMFTRRFLASPDGNEGSSYLLSSGVEFGISPGPFIVSFSALDGGRSLLSSYAGRAMVMRGVGPLELAVGASVLRKTVGAGRWRSAGGFWALGIGPVTWLGEYDETRQRGQLGNLAASEMTVRLARGIDARATYGFQDPQRAVKSGARRQYGLGVAYMPTPYLSLQLMGNRVDPARGAAISDTADHQVDMVIHFFY